VLCARGWPLPRPHLRAMMMGPARKMLLEARREVEELERKVCQLSYAVSRRLLPPDLAAHQHWPRRCPALPEWPALRDCPSAHRSTSLTASVWPWSVASRRPCPRAAMPKSAAPACRMRWLLCTCSALPLAMGFTRPAPTLLRPGRRTSVCGGLAQAMVQRKHAVGLPMVW